MDYINQFEIPIQSMQIGLHQYDFELDRNFFESFEASPVENGQYSVKLELDKRANEFLLNFEINGFFESPCDRCLADINVPSEIIKLIWVKYSDENAGQTHDEDVVYISSAEHNFNVSMIIYELIVLSLPLVKRYDCENDENPRCDFKVLEYMQNEETKGENNLGEQFRKFSKK